MDLWLKLKQEIDQWQTPVTLWWRDDDAVADTSELMQLLLLSNSYRVPCHLAVIPALLEQSLVERLAGIPDIWITQHGYNHQPYAAEGERKRELGGPRPRIEIVEQLDAGAEILHKAFPMRYLNVLVPPWNRYDTDLQPAINERYDWLSVLGPRPETEKAQPPQLNVHVDIINWKTRTFAGDDVPLQQLISHLEQRRSGVVDSSEPTGVMTHHLAHDPYCWAFMEKLFKTLNEHPNVRWLGGRELFPSRRAD